MKFTIALALSAVALVVAHPGSATETIGEASAPSSSKKRHQQSDSLVRAVTRAKRAGANQSAGAALESHV